MSDFIVNPCNDYEAINLDKAEQVLIEFYDYNRAVKRCQDLLYLQDEEVNVNWRELTKDEREELKRFEIWKIIFYYGKDRKVEWEMNEKEAKTLFKRLFR